MFTSYCEVVFMRFGDVGVQGAWLLDFKREVFGFFMYLDFPVTMVERHKISLCKLYEDFYEILTDVRAS